MNFTIDEKMLSLAALVLAVLGLLWYVMHDKQNTLEWYQFIATKATDGKHYADIDKLGKLAGIVFGSWAVIRLAYDKPDLGGFAAVLAAYFAFVGGIAGYSAYLRAKLGLPKAEEKP